MTIPRMLQLEGNPIWFDLATPDPQVAKEFYTGLFGWEWADVPMSDGSTYHMAIRGDANIAGMFAEHTSKAPTGIWVNRICVDDAEKTIERIEVNGGKVLSGPVNADGWGVTAIVATPEGAIFGLWQNLMGCGSDIFAETGAVCWVEYHTHDLEAAKGFYSRVFSTSFEEMKIPNDDGSEFVLMMLCIDGEKMPCAFTELPDESSLASWVLYFMVEDIHLSVAKAESLGAELMLDVMDVPSGSLASLTDPQGVSFNLWQSAG